jgi:hypothetical protein
MTIPTHAQWMFYLDLDLSSQMPLQNDHSRACAMNILPGFGPEFPNANVGQIAVLSHAQACSVDVLPGPGPKLPNVNAQ